MAKAGGNRVVTLPVSLVALDGSQSSDDKEITSYLWEREDKSLAAGIMLNHTDHEPVLLLTNLVPGRYVFTLTVTDAGGLSSKDTASLIVKPEENRDELVEIYLNVMMSAFTEANKKNLASELALLLHGSSGKLSDDVQVQITDLQGHPSGK